MFSVYIHVPFCAPMLQYSDLITYAGMLTFTGLWLMPPRESFRAWYRRGKGAAPQIRFILAVVRLP